MTHLNLPRLVTTTCYNNILKNIANNNSVDIAEQSMIQGSRTLISMYTDNYDDIDIENYKKHVRKDEMRHGKNAMVSTPYWALFLSFLLTLGGFRL